MEESSTHQVIGEPDGTNSHADKEKSAEQQSEAKSKLFYKLR